MNKDLRKVVILLAHPNIKGSQANKALIDAVSDIEGVAVFNLYELSEDIAFNVNGVKSSPTLRPLSTSFLSTGCLPRHY